jgi:hypothetical protein
VSSTTLRAPLKPLRTSFMIDSFTVVGAARTGGDVDHISDGAACAADNVILHFDNAASNSDDTACSSSNVECIGENDACTSHNVVRIADNCARTVDSVVRNLDEAVRHASNGVRHGDISVTAFVVRSTAAYLLCCSAGPNLEYSPAIHAHAALPSDSPSTTTRPRNLEVHWSSRGQPDVDG